MSRGEGVVGARRPTAIAVHHPEGAAERDHLAHDRGLAACELTGVDAAEAPADDRHPAAVEAVQLVEALLDAVHDAAGRTEVRPEVPTVRPPSLAA